MAERRAAHQIVDTPIVLTDPLALKIVGATRPDDRARLAAREQGRLARTLRAFMAARSRLAEDEVELNARYFSGRDDGMRVGALARIITASI